MKVFLSSTYKDLQQHRRVLIDTLSKLGTNIVLVAMEYFGSNPLDPIQLSVQKVSESDVYIGVFGWRYGAVDRYSKMSITEIEYRTALAKGLPVLLYLSSENFPVIPTMVDTGRGATKIRNLRKEILERHTVQFFSTPEDLARLVTADLHCLLQNSSIMRQSPMDKIDKPVGPEINPTHPFMLCHLAKPSRIEHHYDVQLFIDLYEKDEAMYQHVMQSVDIVIYQLHESFRLPVVPMQNWRENFRLELRAWGEFWARATLFLKDGSSSPISMLRYINIDLPWPLANG